MNLRGFPVPAPDLHKVIHIVAVETREGGHVNAVAFALLQFVKPQEARFRIFQIAFLDELVIMVVREEGGVYAFVEHQAEAAFGGEVAQLLIAASCRQLLLHFFGGYGRIPALPGREQLHVRPPVLELRLSSALFLDAAQEVRPFGVGYCEAGENGAYLRRNVELFGYASLFYVFNIVVEIFFRIVYEFQQGGWVGSHYVADAVGYCKSHHHIVAGCVVANVIDLRRGDEALAYDGRNLLGGDSGD